MRVWVRMTTSFSLPQEPPDPSPYIPLNTTPPLTDLARGRRLLRDGLRRAIPLVVHHKVPPHDLTLTLICCV